MPLTNIHMHDTNVRWIYDQLDEIAGGNYPGAEQMDAMRIHLASLLGIPSDSIIPAIEYELVVPFGNGYINPVMPDARAVDPMAGPESPVPLTGGQDDAFERTAGQPVRTPIAEDGTQFDPEYVPGENAAREGEEARATAGFEELLGNEPEELLGDEPEDSMFDSPEEGYEKIA